LVLIARRRAAKLAAGKPRVRACVGAISDVEMAGNTESVAKMAGEKALLIFLSSIVPCIEELVLFATNGNFKRFQIL
jgi:hypothetical protein